MKKLAILLIAVMVTMLSAGCGSDAGNAAGTDASENSDKVSVLEEDENGKAVMPEKFGTVNKLGQYKGLTVTLNDATVTDDEVEDEIEAILEDGAELKEVDRAAKEGDTVNIDYVGKKDGVAFDGGTAEGYDLELGSDNFIDGFEDGLIGAKAGEERVLKLTFPENYASTDLAGAETEFTVKVNKVQEKVMPELTDAWVEEYTGGEQKTVDEYKKTVKSQLEDYRKTDVEAAAKNELISKVIEDSDVTVDDAGKEYFYKVMMQRVEEMAGMYGMTLDEYLQAAGQEPSSYKLEIMNIAEESAKQRLISDAIMEAEGLKVEDADYQAYADDYGYTVEEMREYVGDDILDNSVISYKVIQFVYDNAKKQ